ncbi:MAG: hypothetical protein KAS63_06910 [Candidatus Heimdallarchaeota archaeon]|nr:hypothetical protein [Candidatus Heimdallarchaeota archaeon]MCK4955075.1 hypothetical protein [Candidatus Heimdallarchaeota archaeon]
MNKKKTIIILGAFCILLFGLVPLATANDYVTYGDVQASFNAMLNGGNTLIFNAEFDIEREILPAVLDGRFDGRIVPWYNGMTYRYEDAHGIYGAIYVTEEVLQFAQFILYYYFGVIFTYDNINEGCMEYLSWFTTTATLNGEPLEMKYTPIKNGNGVDVNDDPILWWFNVGTLFKPGELEPGQYHLVTYYWMNPLGIFPYPIPNFITPPDDIWFTIE